MPGVARTTERVWGTVDEMGWGFRTLLGETPVLNFFTIGSVMNAALRISSTSFLINMACFGRCGNINRVLFFLSKGCVSSSSSESVCVEASLFYTSSPKLDPTPTSLPFFFNILTGKM
jgi:hypothetical protein